MIARQYRLSKERFNAVFNNGVVLRSPHFLVRALSGTPVFKCAVVAGKKIAKTAVARNTLRRKVFAGITVCTQTKKIPHGEFIFFISKLPLPCQDVMCGEILSIFSGLSESGVKNKPRIQ